jgi:hypothetical protein
MISSQVVGIEKREKRIKYVGSKRKNKKIAELNLKYAIIPYKIVRRNIAIVINV